jgi:ribosome-binding protein aMBF1 (putative translation factor)
MSRRTRPTWSARPGKVRSYEIAVCAAALLTAPPALAEFAAQLRAWRQRSGWSQAELADKLLCSDSLVSGVET